MDEIGIVWRIGVLGPKLFLAETAEKKEATSADTS